jgi:hypothetical protein
MSLLPFNDAEYTVTVLNWTSHLVTGYRATHISYTAEFPSFWPWGKPKTYKHTAIRGGYDPLFRDELTGNFVPDRVAGLVSVWEAKKNAT